MLPTSPHPAIAPEGLAQLDSLWSTFDSLSSILNEVTEIGGEEGARQAARIGNKINSFEPTITLIGQVKAGKTALINAMVGQTDLLPSDVNPWTSVVTSLHLNSRRRPEGTKAFFQFFDNEEWDRLVSTGGRLGEMSQRAGFDEEKDEIRNQVVTMREKSRTRLGQKFELLLGTTHTFDEFDRDLIDRYVCHGGWEDDHDTTRGRFADITKLASLYLDLPGYPTGLCLRDTPGVNDTFMMREQITINSIRDSRLCVVVLSAHQALSTMDMALLRLIANVDARDVILFVNRIDELDDPTNEVPEIEANFRETLRSHDIAEDVQIIFGSAYWAQHALADALEDLPDSSGVALENYAESDACETFLANYDGLRDLVWNMSGVPALHQAIAQRVVAGPGKAMVSEIRSEIENLLTSLEMAGGAFELNDDLSLDQKALKKRIKETEKHLTNALTDVNKFARDALSERLGKSQHDFANRAVEALHSHLDTHGPDEIWQYNPAGLRMMLRSAYTSFGATVDTATQDVFSDACRQFEDIYISLFGIDPAQAKLNPPATARLLPPMTVGQTIALDLNVSWWRKWLGTLRGKRTTTTRYTNLVLKETGGIVAELSDEMAPALCDENAEILQSFIDTQRSTLLALAEKAATGSTGSPETAERLEQSRKMLNSIAA